ncbi:MAG: UDP-N-acetylglucosamine pyrophosphorylase, partial [Clostridia bacterium]|nr:UDP-N-acetylglucosamine pyrophosphorylase [Clostridia bacterium]
MYEKLKTKALFLDTDRTIAWDYLSQFEYPWQALDTLADYIRALGKTLPEEEYDNPSEGVYIAKDAKIAPTAYIGAPTIICQGAEVRHGAYIRGGAIVGRGAVVGNSVELKNAILFDGVQVPHFNYVGDSILGYKSHMGAGAVTSNVKSDKSEVSIRYGNERVMSGRRKFGAILADYVEVGCNSVLNTGTI